MKTLAFVPIILAVLVSVAAADVTIVTPPGTRYLTPQVEEEINLDGVWAGTASVEREGETTSIMLSINIRYQDDRIRATIQMRAGDGSTRVSEADGNDSGNGTLTLDETSVTSAYGVFEGAGTRGFAFEYSGPPGRQPNRMTSVGGNFFEYRSYQATLTRNTTPR